MVRTMGEFSRAARYVLVALLALLLLPVGVWLLHVARASSPPPLVLYIEHPSFERSGRAALEKLATHARTMFASEAIEWHFVTALPSQPELVRLAIERLRPRAVVFANDDFVETVAGLPRDIGYVIPSDLPASVIAGRYAHLREQHRIAFVSWYADDHDKLIALLEHVCGRSPARIVAFFDRDYVARGIAADFMAAAQRLGAPVSLVEYDDFDAFRRRFAEVLAQQQPDAVHIPISTDMFAHAREAADLVAAARLPAVYSRRDQVWNGGLVSADGPNDEPIDQMALYTGLIVRGANASQLAIAQPTRYEVAVNLGAAQKIGCTVPYEMLVEAVEIIAP